MIKGASLIGREEFPSTTTVLFTTLRFRWDQGSKGKIYLLDGAKEVRAEVVNARAQECVSSSGPPVGAGPQVPCE